MTLTTNSESLSVSSDESSAPPTPPFLRFYFPDNLRAKTLTILSRVEQAKDRTQHRGALAGLVVELTNSGMDYYFLRPLRLAKVGFIVEQSANVGMTGVTQLLGSVIHNVIGHMDNSQLLTVCTHIRQLME